MGKEETGPDRWLLLTTISLIMVGVLIVFDASYARSALSAGTNHNPFFYLIQQGKWAGLSLVTLLAAMQFPYERLRAWSGKLLAISGFLVFAVLIIGIEVNGSRRWLGFGPIRFQPSELAKIALVIGIAAYSDWCRQKIRHPRWFAPPVAAMLVIGGLVAKEDLGTAISLVVTCFAMLFLAGARPAHMGALVGLGLLAGLLLIAVEPYRMERIRAWFDPWGQYDGSGYQPVHGLVALGSGGVFGQGIARGTQKFLYLPAEHTDYIFATIGEELGLIGCVGLLLAFGMLVLRGLTVAHRARDWFGSLLASGLTLMLAVQAMLNVAVVTGTVPATGVPLPFISYGGSSLLFTTLAVGIILNISQNRQAQAETLPVGKGATARESRHYRRRHRWAHLPGA